MKFLISEWLYPAIMVILWMCIPICKKPVGERLARGALNKTYQKNVIPSGPLFRGANVRGGKVFLSFDYGKGMRSSDGKPLQCFEVAEYDGIHYPATAEVVGDQVKVYSKEVPNPAMYVVAGNLYAG